MRILWVKPGKLLPLDSGGKLRSYHILRHLSRDHDVVFLSYYGGPRDHDYEQRIGEQLPGTLCAPGSFPVVTGAWRYLDYARRLVASVPYSVSQYTSSRVRKLIAEQMAQKRFDIVVCDFLASTQTLPLRLTTPTVLFQHNVESVLWKRRSQFNATRMERIVAKIEHAKMTRYEPAQVRRFHRVLAVSEEDRQAMSLMLDPSRISVVPTGVDLTQHRYDPDSRPSGPLVVFTGSMDWQPNIDAVEYFCREIWPQVLTNAPEARFRIVGRKPHIRVKRLASPSIEVTGSVPSILPHLRDAAVLVVPLRMGGGTRVKIYEGMAMGKAMVSTFIGAEGLQVNDRRDILLADDPKQFAEFVVMLLGNEDVRRRYEAAAAAAVRNLDWSGIAQRFVKEAEKAVESVSRRKADELARTPNLRDLLGRSVSRRRNSYANSLKRDVNYENSR